MRALFIPLVVSSLLLPAVSSFFRLSMFRPPFVICSFLCLVMPSFYLSLSQLLFFLMPFFQSVIPHPVRPSFRSVFMYRWLPVCLPYFLQPPNCDFPTSPSLRPVHSFVSYFARRSFRSFFRPPVRSSFLPCFLPSRFPVLPVISCSVFSFARSLLLSFFIKFASFLIHLFILMPRCVIPSVISLFLCSLFLHVLLC